MIFRHNLVVIIPKKIGNFCFLKQWQKPGKIIIKCMAKIRLIHKFEDIISVDNLLLAWKEFIKGKKNKIDVQEFEFRLMDNILSLHQDLSDNTYKHGGYQAFKICDPKPRDIHKATVRDRLLHRAVYRILYPFFDKTFISDSYSCRINKGTHRAINRFRNFGNKVSKNNTITCWILKCDIRKFFASVNHEILLNILREYIPDERIIWLLKEIIYSFNTTSNIGLPLGNLTSQLFANIYLNKLDQFVRRELRAKFYVRYSDDFVIFSQNKKWLKEIVFQIGNFLKDKLKLNLHPNKVSIKTLNSGQDFLGWVNFSNHRVLRTSTKKRMFRRAKENSIPSTLSSYFGLLSHGNTDKIKREIIMRGIF